ncbi:protein of unknown function [Desulfacinum hydrothermale DSM 13146]|uniref:DUF2760 domain-containing protein n=1 Tax=Desulfacinum hydrothermale DSM 13146 TaxID=1121390 RepID=A0A1W1XUE9_9BACT|nr:DUF2760 domain-containing protein [Desulfacinum hydrothermale]SMC27492.1 protein of unknown function [Desulfacinum hydrothermale DSM 13146]
MSLKNKMTWQTLIVLALFQAVVLAAFYFMARHLLQGMEAWVKPFLGADGSTLPQEALQAFTNLETLMGQAKRYLPAVVFGLGGLGIVITWLAVQGLGRSLIGRAQEAGISAAPVAPAKSAREKTKTEGDALPEDLDPKTVGAAQILSILQRQGRFIDFLEEDLGPYEDAQIGAAVRTIHESCKAALAEYVQLETVMDEEEGAQVTIPVGFDAAAIRLTGQVEGDPPFRGVLRHRGWRIRKIQLPRITAHLGKEKIVAPAEVEVGGDA